MPFVWMLFALVGLVATLSVTEMVRVFAHRLSAVDRPGGRRIHRRPTARLGGLGIYWGFHVALALATYGPSLWREPLHGDDPGMIGMMLGSSLLLIVGVMDDVYGLKATLKLAFQFGAAFLLYAFGWRVETIGLPGVGVWSAGVLSLPLTVFWVLLVTNAVNLIDGLDGLACGVALVATVSVCVLLATSGGPLLLVAAALAGALLGFLWFNVNPALIFMGDAGSLFVGFVLSAITLRAGQISSPESFPVIPALLLTVPIFDTCDAIRRRTLAAARSSRSMPEFLGQVKARLFAPDGMHVHHRLVRVGLSTRRAVGVLWLAAAAFAGSGCVMLREHRVGLLLFVAIAFIAWRVFRVMQARWIASLPVPWPADDPALTVTGIEAGEAAETQHAA